MLSDYKRFIRLRTAFFDISSSVSFLVKASCSVAGSRRIALSNLGYLGLARGKRRLRIVDKSSFSCPDTLAFSGVRLSLGTNGMSVGYGIILVADQLLPLWLGWARMWFEEVARIR